MSAFSVVSFGPLLKSFGKRRFSDGPLSGIKVVDMTRVLAGPMASQYLGDYGADVLKIEVPERGDETRHYPPFYKNTPFHGAMFMGSNRNKKSISVNIKHPKGAEIIQKLSEKSDVFLENYKPQNLAKYGLDYPNLSISNPSLIYCSITAFGDKGPLSSEKGRKVRFFFIYFSFFLIPFFICVFSQKVIISPPRRCAV